jgi:hypothetical protein
MSDNKLTITDAVNLNVVISAAQGCKHVTRLIREGNAEGVTVNGTARSLGNDQGMMMPGLDVRDMFLRVTTEHGWEVFWPVRELMDDVSEGFFALDMW